MASANKDCALETAVPAQLAIRLPLSDAPLDLQALNKVFSSAQTREKSLKIIQYSAKLLAYFLVRSSAKWKPLGTHFDGLAKNLSVARRFFKFLRWLKHFEDIADARFERQPAVRSLLYFDIVCNLAADVSEDFTSLEKVGILRKGTLPARTEYYSNWCQLVLAVTEIAVSYIKANRARASAASPVATVAVQRKRVLAELEFSKFIADLVKAFWDCELSFASELAFCISGLWAALVSTHKYALRVLK